MIVRTLVVRCPRHDTDGDARAFEPVVRTIETFVPGVEVVRPGLCAFGTRGPARFFGGDELLVTRLRRSLPDGAQVGIADGIFAATLAARLDAIVPPGETPAFLAPLPVAVLDVDRIGPEELAELADLLRRLGVHTLGDLATLPVSAVLERFGLAGARAHRLARGLDDHPPTPRVSPPDLTVSAELDPPVERVDAAAFVAKSLADELHARLSAHGLVCSRVRIEAETEHGERLTRVWRHSGWLTAAALAERARWQLDGWLHATEGERPTAGVTLLRLVPDQVGPDRGRQSGFWGGAVADDRVTRALARLQGMLGPDAVATAILVGGRGPAERVRLVPWGDACDLPRDSSPWPGRLPAPAPATVHAVPSPVDIDGLDVVAWSGAWPVDERWWDPPTHHRRVRRQVVTADSGAHLLLREGGQWFVEATYD